MEERFTKENFYAGVAPESLREFVLKAAEGIFTLKAPSPGEAACFKIMSPESGCDEVEWGHVSVRRNGHGTDVVVEYAENSGLSKNQAGAFLAKLAGVATVKRARPRPIQVLGLLCWRQWQPSVSSHSGQPGRSGGSSPRSGLGSRLLS